MKRKTDWIERWVRKFLCNGYPDVRLYAYYGSVIVGGVEDKEAIDSLRRAEKAARKGKLKP